MGENVFVPQKLHGKMTTIFLLWMLGILVSVGSLVFEALIGIVANGLCREFKSSLT